METPSPHLLSRPLRAMARAARFAARAFRLPAYPPGPGLQAVLREAMAQAESLPGADYSEKFKALGLGALGARSDAESAWAAAFALAGSDPRPLYDLIGLGLPLCLPLHFSFDGALAFAALRGAHPDLQRAFARADAYRSCPHARLLAAMQACCAGCLLTPGQDPAAEFPEAMQAFAKNLRGAEFSSNRPVRRQFFAEIAYAFFNAPAESVETLFNSANELRKRLPAKAPSPRHWLDELAGAAIGVAAMDDKACPRSLAAFGRALRRAALSEGAEPCPQTACACASAMLAAAGQAHAEGACPGLPERLFALASALYPATLPALLGSIFAACGAPCAFPAFEKADLGAAASPAAQAAKKPSL